MPRTGAPRKVEITIKIRKRTHERLLAAAEDKSVTPDKLVDQTLELWLIEHGY